MRHIQLLMDPVSFHSIRSILVNRKENIAIVENHTTGGLFQAMITMMENTSDFYAGGIIINNYNKKNYLRNLAIDEVKSEDLERIACQLAEHVSKVFNCDWGLTILTDDEASDLTIKKSWIAVHYRNKIVISVDIPWHPTGKSSPDLYVQKTIKVLLQALTSGDKDC